MSFTILHPSDAIEDPVGTFPQAQWDRKDIEIITAGFGNVGVLTGCAVTAQGTPNMSVHVAAGTVMVGGSTTSDIINVSAGDPSVSAAHATLPRKDLVVASSLGALSVVAGTAASVPVFPAIPANSVVLAAVYVPAADTAIQTNQIVDKRMPLPTPPAPSAATWTTVSKPSDTTRSNTTTLSADPHLVFAMLANTKYRVRAMIEWDSLAASDFKYGFDGPASPTLVRVLHRTIQQNNTAGSPYSGFGQASAYNTVGTQITSTGDLTGITFLDGIIHNGANAGNFAFTWSQNTAVVENTIVRAGSYIEYGVA